MYSFMIKRRKLLERAIKNNYTIKETTLYLNTSYVNIDIALFEAKNTDYEFYLKALKNFNITEENHINKKTSGVTRSKNNIEKRLNIKFNTIDDFYKYIKDTAIYIIDNNLSNGRYPVVGGGSKSGMVVVDGNTGGIRYYGGEMTIFTTISYPVKES